MSPISFKILKIKYTILDSIILGKIKENELASAPCYLEFYKLRLRLPFYPFLRYMLNSLGCAPAQLRPNMWHAMISMYILWKLFNFLNPTFSQFRRLYVVKPILKKRGDPPFKEWHYIRAWP